MKIHRFEYMAWMPRDDRGAWWQESAKSLSQKIWRHRLIGTVPLGASGVNEESVGRRWQTRHCV